MKSFNLEEYLANPSRKVVTRDGKEARIICTDKKTNEGYPILALVKIDNIESCYSYTKKGEVYANRVHSLDLFFVEEKKEGWVNIYKNDSWSITGNSIYSSKEIAKEKIIDSEKYITTTKIEWEE